MSEPTADLLNLIARLELQALQVVEGYLTGSHRSPRHGFAVEFAQHREYVPGDDVRHIDWKVVGRADRFFLKQYEQETNLVAWSLVDASESMAFASGEQSKYELACTASLALAHLLVRQTDAIGLATFDSELRDVLRPAGRQAQLKDFARALARGCGSAKTGLEAVFHEAAERFKRRGVVMIFSDLFDDPPAIIEGLRHLKHQRHEVIVFQVLDVAEVEFPYRQPTLFRGLEGLPDLLTDPLGVRKSYLQEFRSHQEELERGCRSLEIDLIRLITDQPLGPALAEYLSQRGGTRT